jgi:DAK2 domain fusion protein YloV
LTHQITGDLLKAMILNGAAAIENCKTEINELNVFPVPDGDTGTNMSLTMNAAAAALKESKSGLKVGKAADIAAGALLRGARGNSGVILSLLFRGLARHLKDCDAADSLTFAAAITAGVESAYKAVMKPAEGTILTVSRLAAAAAVTEAERSEDIESVLEHALAAGKEALADTVNINPVLKKAGVVDAGGKGYLLILDGMLRALRGEVIDVSSTGEGEEKADFAGFETEDITFTYCTEFIVSRETEKNPSQLRVFLEKLGDSIVVVDDEEIIKVHVHTNDPGVVLTEALTYGPLLTIKIENMREQHSAKVVEEEETKKNAVCDPVPAEKDFGVVAVCAGDGMASVFRDLGVDHIIVGGQTMNPSAEDILAKVNLTPAETVFVLPNNKNIIMAAEQCKALTSRRIIVLPSRSMPQGVSAMLAFDPTGSADDNTEAMKEAISRVHTAHITYAARDSIFGGHTIAQGDYLALLDDTLLATGKDTLSLVDAIGKALAAFTPEFLTVFTGEGADSATSEDVLRRLSAMMPNAEVSMVSGGQPVYSYMISAE